MSTATCIASQDDGTRCRALAHVRDQQRGGMVCLRHVPAEVAEAIRRAVQRGTLVGSLQTAGNVYHWRYGEVSSAPPSTATASTPVDFSYTRPELEALFRYARAHDVEQGGRYDARSAAIHVWSHHWLTAATRAESEVVGTFYCHWDTPAIHQLETDAGFTLEDLMRELGRLELQALGYVKHGDVPHEGSTG